MSKISGIYVIYNRVSKKIYIGSSIDIRARFSKHKRQLRRNMHDNQFLQNSWNKHGETSFKFSILEEVSADQLLQREQFWIDKIKNKFNILKKAGNSLGFRHSDKTRQKLSELASQRTGERNPFFGRSLHSNTVSRSIEVCKKKFKGEGNPFYGKIHSTETRKKISEKQIGKKMSDSFRQKQAGNTRGAKTYIVTHPHGEVETIRNLKEFCEKHSLQRTNASAAASSGKPYKGFYFKSA